MFGAVTGTIIGGALPMLWGDSDIFSVTSILLSVVGGLVGIWLAVSVIKRL